MSSFRYSRAMHRLSMHRFWITGVLAAVLAFLGTARPTGGQDIAGVSKTNPSNTPIHIVADMLTTNSEARVAEFIGNVRATQADTVITSDRLKIFYAEGATGTPQTSEGESAIEKIVASGNVRISLDNKVAETQEAVYNSHTKILILSGPDSKITSGSDSISGEKITYSRSDGHLTVERGRDSRVEAVFHSGGGGIR